MRILVLGTIYFPELDGHVRLIHNHSKELARRNHYVQLITPKRKPSHNEEIIDEVHVLRVNSPRIRGKLIPLFRSIALIRGIVRVSRQGKSFDLVYSLGILPGIAAILTRFLTGAKVALSLADLTGMRDQRKFGHRMYRLVALQLIRLSDLTVFPTQFGQKIVLEYCRIPSKEIVVVPPGTDLRFFTPDFSKRGHSGMILYAGILRRRKGLDILIRSFSKVAGEFPNSKLVLVGEGGGRRELEKLVSDLGITDRVVFTGRVSEEELRRYHSIASVYVMPTQFDAYATSLVEAMSMGEAVVATNGSAPAEIVQHGRSGLLFDLGNVEQLASALRLLLSNPELANQLGLEAMRTVREKYSLDAAIDRLEEHFKSILSQ